MQIRILLPMLLMLVLVSLEQALPILSDSNTELIEIDGRGSGVLRSPEEPKSDSAGESSEVQETPDTPAKNKRVKGEVETNQREVETNQREVETNQREVERVKAENEQLEADVMLVFCIGLALLYLSHMYKAWVKQQTIDLVNDKGKLYVEFKKEEEPAASWTFFAMTLVFPLLMALLSIFISPDSSVIPDAEGDRTKLAVLSSYHFSKSVFLLMITLEISYLYNLRQHYWRTMLATALGFDIVAFIAFTMAGAPQVKLDDVAYGVYHVGFLAVLGLASLGSSFLTIYFSRWFEDFANGRSTIPSVKARDAAKPAERE